MANKLSLVLSITTALQLLFTEVNEISSQLRNIRGTLSTHFRTSRRGSITLLGSISLITVIASIRVTCNSTSTSTTCSSWQTSTWSPRQGALATVFGSSSQT